MTKTSRKSLMRKQKKIKQAIAMDTICSLLEHSFNLRNTNLTLARKYYLIALRIGMKTRIHFPKEKKVLFCKYCKTPFSGHTIRVRLNSKKRQINYYCPNCHKITKRGY